jgi:hypothetical protein
MHVAVVVIVFATAAATVVERLVKALVAARDARF